MSHLGVMMATAPCFLSNRSVCSNPVSVWGWQARANLGTHAYARPPPSTTRLLTPSSAGKLQSLPPPAVLHLRGGDSGQASSSTIISLPACGLPASAPRSSRCLVQQQKQPKQWHPSGRNWWSWERELVERHACSSSSARTNFLRFTFPQCLKTMWLVSKWMGNRWSWPCGTQLDKKIMIAWDPSPIRTLMSSFCVSPLATLIALTSEMDVRNQAFLSQRAHHPSWEQEGS